MSEQGSGKLLWYKYRVWVWSGPTVVPYIGDVLANDIYGAEDIIVNDLCEGKDIAHKIVNYKGTLEEYRQYEKARCSSTSIVELE